jgi:hypothetical protein
VIHDRANEGHGTCTCWPVYRVFGVRRPAQGERDDIQCVVESAYGARLPDDRVMLGSRFRDEPGFCETRAVTLRPGATWPSRANRVADNSDFRFTAKLWKDSPTKEKPLPTTRGYSRTGWSLCWNRAD